MKVEDQKVWQELSSNYIRSGDEGVRIVLLTEDLASGLERRLEENEDVRLVKLFAQELDEWWARNRPLSVVQYEEVLFLLSTNWYRGEELVTQFPTPMNLLLTLIFEEKIRAQALEAEQENQ